MTRRTGKVTVETLSGLLLALPAPEVSEQVIQTAIHTTHALWQGKIAIGNVFALADRAQWLLRWRFLCGLSLKFALPVLVLLTGAGALREWNPPVPVRIEKLGKAWGALDSRVARHRQFMMQTPPNAPNYQQRILDAQAMISRASSRVIGELQPLLTPPDDRDRFAKFLTAELDDTLKLSPAVKDTLFSYIRNRLTQGATFNDAMKALAETTKTEAAEIKSMLSMPQRQLFDHIYGEDGVLLFSYAKAVALGQIGP
jgi:hypothetical protein